MRRLASIKSISEQEFLRLENESSTKHEFVQGYVFAMSGTTAAHNVIAGNLFAALHSVLRGSPCRAYMNDMKVRIEAAQSYYYPDLMVTCETFDRKSVFMSNPVLLVEVLSRGTAQIDRREKLIAYQKIESLSEYVLLHQDRQRFEMYRRGADGDWLILTGDSDDDLTFTSIGDGDLTISMSSIYEGCVPPHRVKEPEEEYCWDC